MLPMSPPFHKPQISLNSPKTQTLKSPMATQQINPNHPQKRPFCNRCSKPLRLCLCSRLKSPPLDNDIGITILQHSLEKNHPLNSTRVARIGFKNLDIVAVTDVNFTAQFIVRPINRGERLDFAQTRLGLNGKNGISDANFLNKDENSVKKSLDDNTAAENLDLDQTHLVENGTLHCKVENFDILNKIKCHKVTTERLDFEQTRFGVDGENGISDVNLLNNDEDSVKKSLDDNPDAESLDFDQTHLVKSGTLHCKVDNFDILKKIKCNKVTTERLDFDKYQVICTSNELQILIGRTAKPDISWILETPLGRNFTANGFTVKKIQKELSNSKELIQFAEFDITIPPGAALLFPSANSVSLDEVKFEVKQLIVLDGTWAKAQRMYHENSWLKLLPHIKLSSVKESLYSEVRQQPKSGCLSTIESIVYTLKGLGRDTDNSDELLNVFESMIGDQRRMKDENFKKKVVW